MTNAVFLLGAYMILKEGLPPSAVTASFAALDPAFLLPYRDATFAEPDFDLTLADCWRGLALGTSLGWLRYAASGRQWGKIDLDRHRFYDDPDHGDLHLVVPGKFVAFKGPSLPGAERVGDTAGGLRAFAPAYYAGVLRALGVSDVVRLCAPRYPAAAFSSLGFAFHDLPFEEPRPPIHTQALSHKSALPLSPLISLNLPSSLLISLLISLCLNLPESISLHSSGII